MLRFLILIVTNFIVLGSNANDKGWDQGQDKSWVEDMSNNIHRDDRDAPELEWAEDIAKRDQEMLINNLQDMMQTEGFDPDLRESVLKPRPVLQIFVSASMPRQLLKAYAREASRYDGVLVFRGLPSGSFIKLTNLVMDISDEKHLAAMQIDDEAFRGFNIKAVPTIVLSNPASMFDEQSKPSKFDKVQGNITIKGALELFASKGDLAGIARGLLK